MPVFHFDSEPIAYEEGQTVLEALLVAGKDISYGCKEGVCQSCILKCTQGQLPSKSQKDLKSTLQHEGFFLSCITPAQDDFCVDRGDPPEISISARISSLQKLNDGVMKVLLELEKELDYQPGQYIVLKNEEGQSRCYSVASHPQKQGRFLELHIGYHPGGVFSELLFKESERALTQSLSVRGPLGHCYYTPTPKNLVLMAYGTGLAPLYGLLTEALLQGHTSPITLYYGARQKDYFYYTQELQTLAEAYPQFTYHLVTQENREAPFGELIGTVIKDISHFDGTRFYLCGPKDMVVQARKALYLKGASLGEIYADAFLSWVDEKKPAA